MAALLRLLTAALPALRRLAFSWLTLGLLTLIRGNFGHGNGVLSGGLLDGGSGEASPQRTDQGHVERQGLGIEIGHAAAGL